MLQLYIGMCVMMAGSSAYQKDTKFTIVGKDFGGAWIITASIKDWEGNTIKIKTVRDTHELKECPK